MKPSQELVKRVAKLVRSKEEREEKGLIVIEGANLVREVAKRLPLEHLIVLEPELTQANNTWIGDDLIMSKISTGRTPPTHIAVLKKPKANPLSGRHILCLDQLQDPGNVGTLFRTAYALGWDGIYLITPCVDLFNDKVCRSAKGANLFMPFQIGSLEAFLHFSKGYRLLIADASGSPLTKEDKPTVLILGHETRGVSEAIQERGELISIPMRPESESLNVAQAGAILLFKVLHG